MPTNLIPLSDRRRHVRQRVSKPGKIVSTHLQGAIGVEIHDVNVFGARLRLPEKIELPDRFNIASDSDGILVPVCARWRKGEWIGVSFEGAPYTVPAGA